MPDRELICVGLDLKYWDDVRDDIQRALNGNGGRLFADDFLPRIKENRAQLWGLHDGILRAVMVTEIVNYPQFNVVRIVTVTGEDMDLWLDVLIDTLSKWGKEVNAVAIEFIGRRGWEKVLTKRGFGETQIIMTKAI